MNSEIKRRDALKAIFGGSLLAMAGVSTAGSHDLDCCHVVLVDLPGRQIVSTEEVMRELRRGADK